MTRKKILILFSLMIFIMVSILVGCANSTENKEDTDVSQEPDQKTTYKPTQVPEKLPTEGLILDWEEDLEKEDLDEGDSNNKAENESGPVINIDELVNDNELFIQVYKSERILQLWEGDRLIEEYPIGLGFNPMGHKKQEGDGKTPEGAYYVCVKNPNSRFYLSLGLSYPNINDAQEALDSATIADEEYRDICEAINNQRTPSWYTPLGGEIMIHGHGSDSDWTAGCVAVDNEIMDILWEQCEVGTKVFIHP